jgi:siroheme synthase-like protein
MPRESIIDVRESYYPLFFRLAGTLCVVVGGGRVAERKARALIAAGARVRLISPTSTSGLSGLHRQGKIELLAREYREGDLEGAALVFAATDKGEVNRRVREESRRLAIPMNAADSPDMCDFVVPSLIRKGPLLIAISTSGLLPMLSKKLRLEITKNVTPDYAAYVRRVGLFRKYLLQNVEDSRLRRDIMKRVGKAEIRDVSRMTLGEMKKRFLGPASKPTT